MIGLRRIVGLQLFIACVLVCSACSVVKFNRYQVRANYAHVSVRAHDIALSAGTMRVYEGGEGRPVLLIHGFAFGALETWENQVPVFIHNHHVIAPDLFWFGGSVPKGEMDDAAQQADALSELLNRLGTKRCAVVGVSFGGYVAMRLALTHPEQVEKLVLVDAAGLAPTAEETRRIAANFGGKKHISELLIPKNIEELDELLRILFHNGRYIPKFILREILHDEFWRNREAKLRMCERMEKEGGFLAPAALESIAAPTLLVWGRHDPLILPSMGERLAAAIPKAQIIYFEKSSHSPMLEEPRGFNAQVLRFLRSPP